MASGDLSSVIVGGLLTMGGGVVTFIGTVVRDALQSHKDIKKRRNEKFEELVGALYEFDHWMETKMNITAYGEKVPLAISPFAKLQAISSVYFPQFDQTIRDLNTAALGYMMWMSQAGHSRLVGEIQNVNVGLDEAYRPYMQKRELLLEEFKQFARDGLS
jgi:hypothetical protein